MATFITAKPVGQNITIYIETSTGYWKYNHNGTDSMVFNQMNGQQVIPVTNSNGEFTIISCDSNGTISGDITFLGLEHFMGNNQITSFNGTGLTSLTFLYLVDIMFGGTNPITPEANN